MACHFNFTAMSIFRPQECAKIRILHSTKNNSTPQKRRYTSSANEYILTLSMNIYLLCQRRYPHQLLKLNRTKRIHVSGSGRYKKIETRPKPRLYPYLIYNRMIILRLPLQQPHPQQLQLRYLPVRRL